jgi:hypothetical protein
MITRRESKEAFVDTPVRTVVDQFVSAKKGLKNIVIKDSRIGGKGDY